MVTSRNCRSVRWGACGGALALAFILAGCNIELHQVKVEETQVLELMATDVQKVAAFADNGSIRVRPASGTDTIRVEAKITARGNDEVDAQAALAAVEILTPRSGPGESTQEVRWRWNDRRPKHASASVSFDIEMPAALALAATTENGQIDVRGIEGIRELESDNGSVHACDWLSKSEAVWDGTMSATESKLVATTDNGKIDVETAASTVELATDNGEIALRSAGRHFDLSTNNGSINARLTAAGRIDGQIRADNGAVDVVLNPDASVRLDCQSDDGQVRINLPVKGADQFVDQRRYTCLLGNGDGFLEIETDNGSITVGGLSRSLQVAD